jgi:hypothetical protein
LQGRAEAAGRGADADMATELLQAFGRPEDVAARYRPTLIIIDPADGHRFLRATVIGLVILWSLGLWEHLRQPIDSGGDFLIVLARWWWAIVGTVIPSLWWPGVLVVWYGLSAWAARRRSPQTSAWKPLAGDRIQGGRAAKVMALVGILCGLFLLVNPHWILDVFWGGQAAPAAYEALTYTDTFRQRQAPWLLGLLVLNIPLFIAVIAMGRWPAILRRLETGQGLVLCAAMVWTVLDGPVFMAPTSDRTAKALLLLIVAFTLIYLGIKLYRRVRPAPNTQIQA